MNDTFKLIKTLKTAIAPDAGGAYLLGTVTSASPLNVQWDGEGTTTVTYPSLKSYRPAVSDRVIGMRSGRTFLVLGAVGAAVGNGPRGYMTGSQRITATGAQTTEIAIAVGASFTLTEQRRIRYDYSGYVVASAATTECRLNLHRNTTGSTVVAGDPRLVVGSNVGTGSICRGISEVLAAGTYAAGLTIAGVVTGTATLSAAADNPCVLEIYDVGAA